MSKQIIEKLKESLLETCECLNILAAKCNIQVEGAALRSDADSCGVHNALSNAKELLSMLEQSDDKPSDDKESKLITLGEARELLKHQTNIYGPGNDDYGRNRPLIPSPQHQVGEAIKWMEDSVKRTEKPSDTDIDNAANDYYNELSHLTKKSEKDLIIEAYKFGAKDALSDEIYISPKKIIPRQQDTHN